MDKVIIIAQKDDIHALTVAHRVMELGVPCSIQDTRWLGAELLATFVNQDAIAFDLNELRFDTRTTVWWRRVHLPEFHSIDPDMNAFIAAERKAALIGSLYASGCRIINDPSAEGKANYKPFQLAQAKACGLSIPRTLITNKLNEALAFYDRLAAEDKRCVFKPLTPCRAHMGETRILTDRGMLREEELILAPVIFQECIEGTDIRVFIIEGQVFASEIQTEHEELIDWRLDPLCKYLPYKLPPSLRDKLLRFMSSMELVTGSIDLRLTPDDQYVFFEINASGQFLFLETDAGLPVSQAFAESLCCLARQR